MEISTATTGNLLNDPQLESNNVLSTKNFLDGERGDVKQENVKSLDETVDKTEKNFDQPENKNKTVDMKKTETADVKQENEKSHDESVEKPEKIFDQPENTNETVDMKKETADVKPSTSKGDSEEEKEEWMDILGNGQLKKKVLTPGQPDSRPQKPDICEISFEGKLDDGTVVEKEDVLEINLGDNDTIQGLDFALALMDNGEEAEVDVASRFAYGSLGRSPNIPPDSTIHYKIKLLSTKPEPLLSSLDIEKRIEIGCRKKERGNFWHNRDEHTLAILSYRRALEYLDDTDIPGNPDESRVRFLLSERLKAYNNLGASQLKIAAYDAALISVGHVLSSQPKNVKALFRKAKILKEKGELEESIAVLRQALAIDSDNKSIQQELSVLLAAQRQDNTKQRDLYKKMMGNSSQNNDSDKKKNKSSNIGTITLIAVVSFAVAALGIVAMKYKTT